MDKPEKFKVNLRILDLNLDFGVSITANEGRAVEGRREKMCKCGFFKEMTRWTSVRTIMSLYSRGRGGLVRSTLLCEEKGRKWGRRRRGGVLV